MTLKKILLEGDNEKRAALLWSADPAEWSPVASSPDLTYDIPLTANEYLQKESYNSALHEGKVQDSPLGEAENALEKYNLSDRELKEGNFSALLHQWLPAIIVALLLVGLLGALLSSFLFPAG